jgi:hypothetical protein
MPEIDIETNGKPSENAEATAASIAITPVEGTVKVAAGEPEKANTSKPISYSAKLCLTVTLSAAILAVLFAAGVFDHFSALFNYYMISERSVPSVIVSVVLSGLLSLALFGLLPKRLACLSTAPFLGILYYWVGLLWYNSLDGKLLDATLAITPTSLAAVLLAVAALAFCLCYHDEDELGVRVLGFLYLFLALNALAFFVIYVVSCLVVDMKGEAGQVVASEILVPIRVTEVLGSACPLAYSADYCDLVKKLVESPETKVYRKW